MMVLVNGRHPLTCHALKKTHGVALGKRFHFVGSLTILYVNIHVSLLFDVIC